MTTARHGRRLALLGALLLAVAALAGASARPAEAYVDFFCPETGTRYFQSGYTCGYGEYHHIDQVAFTVNSGYYRHCANLAYGPPGSDSLSTWVCGYTASVIKNGANIAGRGVVHNGDPAGFYGWANENF